MSHLMHILRSLAGRSEIAVVQQRTPELQKLRSVM